MKEWAITKLVRTDNGVSAASAMVQLPDDSNILQDRKWVILHVIATKCDRISATGTCRGLSTYEEEMTGSSQAQFAIQTKPSQLHWQHEKRGFQGFFHLGAKMALFCLLSCLVIKCKHMNKKKWHDFLKIILSKKKKTWNRPNRPQTIIMYWLVFHLHTLKSCMLCSTTFQYSTHNHKHHK